MPAPLLMSVPGDSISSALLVRIVLICAALSDGFADLISAAIAPACGAAAEVPKNGFKPLALGKVVETPSAAVTSGLLRTVPPLLPKRKLLEVIGLPSALKKILRGPSELKVSTWLVAENGFGYGPIAGVAATAKAFTAEACACV